MIIGTAAVKNPGFLQDACTAFAGHIIVGLDAKDGKVAVDGWSKMTGHDVVDLARKFQDYGVEAIIYTDIGRDGMLIGVNIEATVALARELRVPVIASGGLTNLDDVERAVRGRSRRHQGAITGRAIYRARWTSRQAQAIADRAESRRGRRRGRTSASIVGLAKRIIPCLDVTAGRVVKGVNFVELRDAGDPVEIARRYDEQGADELTFLDITASSDDRDIILHVIESGGGAGVHPAHRRRRRAPASRTCAGCSTRARTRSRINTAAVQNPQLVADAAGKYGSQCIVVAIDAKRVDGRWEVFTHGGRNATGLDAVEWARRMQAAGAGESCSPAWTATARARASTSR